MSQIKTIFNNMSWLLVSQIIASICGFIWTILMARYLGVSKYGILGFGISLTGILAITLDFGISSHIVRSVATDYDSAPKYLGNVIPLKSIFSIGTFVLTLIILIIMKADQITITVTLLFSIETIINTFKNLLNGVFQAFEEGKYQGIGNIISNLLLFAFILITIYTDLDIYGITFSYILANLIALIYEYYVLNKHIIKPKFEFNWSFCKKVTLLSIPFALASFFYTIYYSIDVVMLTHLVGAYPTGIYNAAYKLISVLTLFYSIYVAVIFPAMNKFYKNDERLLTISLEKSIKYLSLIMVPIAVATMFYSKDIIQLIYGNTFDAASSALSILIWTVCLLFINGACAMLLQASHKEVTVTKIYAIAAIFNIVLNIFMIPHYSYNGAAFTTVMSDLLILIIFAYIIYKLKYTINKKLYLDIVKILLGSGILGIALYLLNLNMWVALPVGIIIYLIAVWALRVFDGDDKYVINEILGRN